MFNIYQKLELEIESIKKRLEESTLQYDLYKKIGITELAYIVTQNSKKHQLALLTGVTYTTEAVICSFRVSGSSDIYTGKLLQVEEYKNTNLIFVNEENFSSLRTLYG